MSLKRQVIKLDGAVQQLFSRLSKDYELSQYGEERDQAGGKNGLNKVATNKLHKTCISISEPTFVATTVATRVTRVTDFDELPEAFTKNSILDRF